MVYTTDSVRGSDVALQREHNPYYMSTRVSTSSLNNELHALFQLLIISRGHHAESSITGALYLMVSPVRLVFGRVARLSPIEIAGIVSIRNFVIPKQ